MEKCFLKIIARLSEHAVLDGEGMDCYPCCVISTEPLANGGVSVGDFKKQGVKIVPVLLGKFGEGWREVREYGYRGC